MPWVHLPKSVCSRECVAPSWASNSSGPPSKPSATSKTLPTASGLSRPESRMDALTMPQSGTTSRPSTGDCGLDAWILSLADSLARTSVVRDAGRGLWVNGQVSGLKCFASLVKPDRESWWWRMSQLCLGGELTPFSGRWPRRGMMLSGQAYGRRKSAHRIGGRGSLSWPTPKERDYRSAKGEAGLKRDSPDLNVVAYKAANWPTPDQFSNSNARGKEYTGKTKHAEKLRQAIDRNWQTPTAAEAAHPGRKVSKKGSQIHLAVQVSGHSATGQSSTPGSRRGWSTPRVVMPSTAHQSKSGGPPGNLRVQAGGQLNPDWVEALMGVPIGWTDCGHSVTGLCLSSWRRLSLRCLTASAREENCIG